MSTPINLISVKEYKAMKDAFNTTIKGKLGSQETDSVWFSFDNLKEYLAYLEDESAKKNLLISGISFQMIATDDAAKRLTIALTPTFEDNGKQTAFDLNHSSTDSPMPIEDINSSSNNFESTSSILNRGNIGENDNIVVVDEYTI